MSHEVMNVAVEAEARNGEGGSFLVSVRIPKQVWAQMKAAGAMYWGQDELEDMGDPTASPGWRYPAQAIAVLFDHGYQVTCMGQVLTTREEWFALWTAEAVAERQAQAEVAVEAAVAARERTRADKEAAHEAELARYEEWKTEHLTGMVQTSVQMPGKGTLVEKVYFRGCGHHETGTRFEQYSFDGETVYQEWYGNARFIWMSPPMAHQVYAEQWTAWTAEDPAKWARWALRRHAEFSEQRVRCIGDDMVEWVMQNVARAELEAMAAA